MFSISSLGMHLALFTRRVTILPRACPRITEDCDWMELHEIMIGSQPPRKYMEIKVSPQK